MATPPNPKIPIREYRYTVDRDGRIFHDGSEIIDPVVLRFFLLAMQHTEDGRYLVMCQNERNWFEAPDTPFVVQRVQCRIEQEDLVAVELHFVGDYHEAIDPDTLETDGPYLYCRVRRRLFRARLGRHAVQQLAPFLAEEGGRPVLLLGGHRWVVHQAERPLLDRSTTGA